ncbi:hypothetical protein N0V93_001654 [Gnomoniopsis smithogilvyi]|uniref:Uncharacterized protein n=1 Tax=Gnomoniopsis smithogilvyi TaxID=1191159 RepID=A0A9W8Z3Y9_9PEZI|nr:hypothetical protein N0V93_001654 [Gnomoniopsis smithogilvyi]
MVLRLHVLGPAFGLASVDAECLATITYLAYAVPHTEYELVATSASGVPTHSLPALQDNNGSWITGFTAIVDYLSNANPSWDLDASLTPAQKADATAYASFLASTAAPLLALNLYVSSANWAATTRPAYSTVLPFPLTWTEPPTIRRRMCDVAAHLGLSDLNIDEQPEDQKQAAASQDSRGFLKVPERLRRLNRGVKAALSPEHAALFRLEAAGIECLGVLADLKGRHDEGRFFYAGQRATTLDCLAFGYLSLMLVPEVPRPWLRDLLRRRYDCLCVFVDGVRDELFGGDVASLPWAKEQVKAEPWRLIRFARGIIEASVPEAWLMGESLANDEGKPWAVRKQSKASFVLSALMNSVAGLGLVGTVLLYRHFSPFGSVLYRWQMQRKTIGAAGAFFGI